MMELIELHFSRNYQWNELLKSIYWNVVKIPEIFGISVMIQVLKYEK
jgi:hypothetical protein